MRFLHHLPTLKRNVPAAGDRNVDHSPTCLKPCRWELQYGDFKFQPDDLLLERIEAFGLGKPFLVWLKAVSIHNHRSGRGGR